MTKQIVIKLNEKKFKPLLDKIAAKGHNVDKSYSELTSKCLFFTYLFLHEELPNLGNKTRRKFIMKHRNMSEDQDFIEIMQKYSEFIKNEDGNH